MLRRFHLDEPETVKDASDLLSRYGESAKIYAGGTELLLAMKEGLIQSERLVNVKKIPGLDEVKRIGDSVHIGALSTHRKLENSAELQQSLPAFVQMEANVANIRVREVGTVGGNLSFSEPHADPGILLLALGAGVVAQNASNMREIPMDKFFVDAFETCLKPDELLTEIRVPIPPPQSAVRYRKFGYLQRPSVGVALHLSLGDGGLIRDVRVAVGCAGPKPCRVEEAEELLTGKGFQEASALIGEAGQIAGRAADAIGDLHGSAEYKEHIIQVLLKRAFHQMVQEEFSSKGEGGPHA